MVHTTFLFSTLFVTFLSSQELTLQTSNERCENSVTGCEWECTQSNPCMGDKLCTSSASECTLNCFGEGSCSGIKTFISSSKKTTVNCYGSASCPQFMQCHDNAKNCEVNCYGENSCSSATAPLYFVSFATNTKMYCGDRNSCNRMHAYCGIHANIPQRFLLSDVNYNMLKHNKCEVQCNHHACVESNVFCSGYFSKKCSVTAGSSSSALLFSGESFKSSSLYCHGTNPDARCELSCEAKQAGQTEECIDSRFVCSKASISKCYCHGEACFERSNVDAVYKYGRVWDVSPKTIQQFAGSNDVICDYPGECSGYLRCVSQDCKLECREQNSCINLIILANGYNMGDFHLKCSVAFACKNVQVLTNAANTNIICSDENSCDSLTVTNPDYGASTMAVSCAYSSSCISLNVLSLAIETMVTCSGYGACFNGQVQCGLKGYQENLQRCEMVCEDNGCGSLDLMLFAGRPQTRATRLSCKGFINDCHLRSSGAENSLAYVVFDCGLPSNLFQLGIRQNYKCQLDCGTYDTPHCSNTRYVCTEPGRCFCSPQTSNSDCPMVIEPTLSPTRAPSVSPTFAPTRSTNSPSQSPTLSTQNPTVTPSTAPTTPAPTLATSIPTLSPTLNSAQPTTTPTQSTVQPSGVPTMFTVHPTPGPTDASLSPTVSPTRRTPNPTLTPSMSTVHPSLAPTKSTVGPTYVTGDPSTSPTKRPTSNPTTLAEKYIPKPLCYDEHFLTTPPSLQDVYTSTMFSNYLIFNLRSDKTPRLLLSNKDFTQRNFNGWEIVFDMFKTKLQIRRRDAAAGGNQLLATFENFLGKDLTVQGPFETFWLTWDVHGDIALGTGEFINDPATVLIDNVPFNLFGFGTETISHIKVTAWMSAAEFQFYKDCTGMNAVL